MLRIHCPLPVDWDLLNLRDPTHVSHLFLPDASRPNGRHVFLHKAMEKQDTHRMCNGTLRHVRVTLAAENKWLTHNHSVCVFGTLRCPYTYESGSWVRLGELVGARLGYIYIYIYIYIHSGPLNYELGRNSKTIFPTRNSGNTYNAFRNSQSTPYLTFS
jgi:hypothetical protein